MPKPEQNHHCSDSVAKPKNGDVDRIRGYFRRYVFPEGNTRMDFLINLFSLMIIISGTGLAVLSVFGAIKHYKAAGVWLGYATVIAALTVFALNWHKSIKQSEDAAVRADEEKAKVAANGSTKERPELYIESNSIDPLVVGQRPKLNLVVKNIGKSSAYRMEIKNVISIPDATVPGPLIEYLVPADRVMHSLIRVDLLPPDERIAVHSVGQIDLTDEQIEKFNTKNQLLFFTGRGQYEDADGTTYPLTYCFMYDRVIAPHSLMICPEKYWPREADGKLKIAPERRGWIVTDDVIVEGFTIAERFKVTAVMTNVGELPAVVKEAKMVAWITSEPPFYSKPLTLEDVDEAAIGRPPQTFPVSVIGPAQKFWIPINGDDPVTARQYVDVMARRSFIQIMGSVTYETRGAIHYTAFCAVYDPHTNRTGICGGGVD
jgi:hypothetical protein